MMDALLLRHWQVVVVALALGNVVGNVLAKRQHSLLALAVWWVTAVGWALVLRSRVPMGRSASFNHVLSYVAALAVSVLLFHEPMKPAQVAGAALGLVAVVLLAL